ncbi:hypothetical protein SAMN05421854_101513 [Amycolatopsis rubida]|uniref:Uncharacterized protein n=1 Tax=Amycolatopsis rubida TaxID=112413 RepID=A0A1I5E6Z0_9PSEU|nr:hypothetical protein SAMN05421854_101513 [Amycolatopsis rubida]
MSGGVEQAARLVFVFAVEIVLQAWRHHDVDAVEEVVGGEHP